MINNEEVCIYSLSVVSGKHYKEGDIVLLENNDLKLCGPISFVDEETIYIGKGII